MKCGGLEGLALFVQSEGAFLLRGARARTLPRAPIVCYLVLDGLLAVLSGARQGPRPLGVDSHPCLLLAAGHLVGRRVTKVAEVIGILVGAVRLFSTLVLT